MASTLTINERTYDAGTLHVAHGRNIKGEPCLQLAGIPVRGMDPHALADLAYPDAATPYAGSLANAAQRALMLLSDMHERIRLDGATFTLDAEQVEEMGEAVADLRAVLVAAKRI